MTTRAYDDARALLSTISIGSLALIGGAIVLVALARRRPRLAIGAFVLVLGSNVTTQVLKRLVLPRPDLLPADLREGGPSFPSGHSTVAMSLALAFVLVVPRSVRTLAAAAGLVYAVGVGVAVIVAGWHRPSDAYGAYLVAFAWACLVAAVLVEERGLGPRPVSEPDVRPAGGRLLLVAGLAILAVAFAILLAVGATRYSDDLSIPTPDRAFAAGALTVGGLGALLVGALLWLLRGVSLDAPRADAT